MADDKNARDKQARDADRRQRERDVTAQLERAEETEPPVEPATLDGVEAELEPLEFPATGAEVVAAAGDREIPTDDGTHTVEDLIAETDDERFDSPAAVRVRVQRPTVAATMKRILEAGGEHAEFGSSQRTAYEKTLRALAAIDADDDDEGVRAVGDWIVDRIQEKQTLPGSRAVRREAAKFCRSNGYEIRNDEWLGV